MKHFVVFGILSASLLAGCGSAPVAPQARMTDASSVEASKYAGFKVQILDATHRQDKPGAMRLVIQYRVTPATGLPILRQVIIDSKPTQDRAMYKTGFQPVQIVMNGFNALQDETMLRKIVKEHEALAYHTITVEQAKLVSLATQILYDHLD